MANLLENCCPEFANACPDVELCGETSTPEETNHHEPSMPPCSLNDQEKEGVCVKDCKCLGEQRPVIEQNNVDVPQNQSSAEADTQKDPVSVNCVPPIVSNLHCEPIIDSLRSVYKTDYDKKRFLIMPYRRLIGSFNSPVCSMMGTTTKGLKYSSYKDPTNFKRFLFEGVGAKPVRPVTTSLDKYQSWSGPFAAVSEYMNTFNTTGMRNLKDQQQYLHPLTPWRRRFGDCKL